MPVSPNTVVFCGFELLVQVEEDPHVLCQDLAVRQHQRGDLPLGVEPGELVAQLGRGQLLLRPRGGGVDLPASPSQLPLQPGALPLYPLDGGQLFRLFMLKRSKSPRDAYRIIHGVGATLAGLGLAWGLKEGSFFIGILAGLMLWENGKFFMGESGRGPAPRRSNPAVDAALQAGQAALAEGNFREAARQGHVVRSYSKLSRAQSDEMWRLIGLGTAGMGDYEDALHYLERAKPSPEVDDAIRQCREAVGRS